MTPEEYKPRDFQWSQRDKRWYKKHLGKSNLICGDDGCASLDVTYVIDRYLKSIGKPFLYPDQVIDLAIYTPDGRIYWNTVDKITKGAVIHTYNSKEANYTLRQVQWGPYYQHWVVKLGTLKDNLCYNSWPLVRQIEFFARPEWEPTGREIYYKIT